MSSYIILEINGKQIPVKVGGYTGKTEKKVKLSKEEAAKIEKAFIEGDKKTLLQFEKRVYETAVEDIRTAYVVWIRKEFSHLVPLDTNELTFLLPSGKLKKVPVRSIKKYGKKPETEGKRATAKSAKAAWFGKPGSKEKFFPFLNLEPFFIWYMLEAGLKLNNQFTLSGKPIKTMKQVTRTVGKANANDFNHERVANLIKKLAKAKTMKQTDEIENELATLINPEDFGLESIQDVLYEEQGEAARVYIAKRAGLTLDDFENARQNLSREVTYTARVTPRKKTVRGLSGEINIPMKKTRHGGH